MQPVSDEVVASYTRAGYWDDESLAERVRRNAREQPSDEAWIGQNGERVTWAQYDAGSSEIGALLARGGFAVDERLAVMLPGGPDVHVTYLGAEKAGVVVMGAGPRTGTRELLHMLGATRCSAILTAPAHRGRDTAELVRELRQQVPALRHLVLGGSIADGYQLTIDGEPVEAVPPAERERVLGDRSLGPNDLFLVNSTSGTTGLPKYVMQTHNRWKYFHKLAAEAAHLGRDDRFMSMTPPPFAFRLWAGHVSPTIVGGPTVLIDEFDVEEAIHLITRERVTVLAGVSSQLRMLVNHPSFRDQDWSALRVMFTGGERVPIEQTAEFERVTGSTVLQFYGSNETGAASRTTLSDPQDKRQRTAGKVIPEMQVRVLDDDGKDVLAGEPGQCACRGPATTPGYFEDPEANAQLHTDDGWMLMSDLVVIDDKGYLTVVGRKSDIIIRGGFNLSGPAMEEEVGAHPDVEAVAVVGMPDPVLGERACAYVSLSAGATLDPEQLRAFLAERGVSKSMWPEHLVILDSLPLSVGGKIDKKALRDDARERSA